MIYTGDCLEVLATLPENSVDTCITDPPYELGFMGKKWDSSGVAFQPETWQEVYRVLKPGAIMLAFGGTRTYHRIACAIEDAGFEIRDTIAWVYGSGFPKNYDISKGIDKQAGAEREVVGERQYASPAGNNDNFGVGDNISNPNKRLLTAPSTPEAQLWHGWGTALKPAFEPIVVAMKPVDGGFVNNALTWGVAGLWIDGGRVETNDSYSYPNGAGGNSFSVGKSPDGKRIEPVVNNPQGRFPANLIHDGSDEVLEVFPSPHGAGYARQGNDMERKGNIYFTEGISMNNGMRYGDSGSAARFFYCAKASRSERNAGLDEDETNIHPTVKSLALMRYLVKLTKTPTGGIVLDPFMGSGTTGIACVLEGRDFIGIEREAEYVEIAEKRIAHYRLPMLDINVQS